ncbi:polymorphic toxin type 17 domain-containing protein, partial [Salinithrix halophila]
FLTRDMYNGAMADMNLGTNPWTMNRYAFAGGNPISGVELDGHDYIVDAEATVTANSKTGEIPEIYREDYEAKEDALQVKWNTIEAQTKEYNRITKAGSTERNVGSFTVGLIPILGEAQDLSILVFGSEPVSGEKTPRVYGLSIFLPFVNGKTVKEGFEAFSKRWSGGGVRGSVGAKVSIRGLTKEAGLPTSGPFRFIPEKGATQLTKVKMKGGKAGYKDRFGNTWVKGPYHGDRSKGFNYEWDVQLSKTGQNHWWNQYSRGKGYINVRPDGFLSH